MTSYEVMGTLFNNYDEALKAVIFDWLTCCGTQVVPLDHPDALSSQIRAESEGFLKNFEAKYGAAEDEAIIKIIREIHQENTHECWCEDTDGEEFRVLIPNLVAEDQKSWDGKRFEAIDARDYEIVKVELDGKLYGLHTTGTGDIIVRLVVEYDICHGTGAGDETVEVTNLDQAKEIADKAARYTQQPITILDRFGDEVCTRKWYGVKFDPEIDPSEYPIDFGGFGYYADWE
jgi:hypothetical protein